MKEYLAMSGYFIGNVTINSDGKICDDKYFRGSTDIAEDYYEPICHAINSHDELVEMNKELIDALEDCVKVMSIDLRGLKLIQPELSKATEAIFKAKGGVESQPNALRDDVYVAGGKA